MAQLGTQSGMQLHPSCKAIQVLQPLQWLCSLLKLAICSSAHFCNLLQQKCS